MRRDVGIMPIHRSRPVEPPDAERGAIVSMFQ